MKQQLHYLLGVLAITLLTGCPASDRIMSMIAEKSEGNSAQTADESSKKTGAETAAISGAPKVRRGIVWTAQDLGVAPLIYAQQGIVARQFGEAIRNYQICFQEPPLTASALLDARFVTFTSQAPDGTPMRYVEEQLPWSMYLVISNGLYSWQINRERLADSPPVVHSALNESISQIDSSDLALAVDREASLRNLPADEQRPLEPVALAALIPDAGRYLKHSTDPRDARVRLLGDGLRHLMGVFLELEGRLPTSWDELKHTLKVELSTEGGCLVVPPDALWKPDEGGVVLQVDAAGQYFRWISKPTVAATAPRYGRVIPHKSGQGFSWVPEIEDPGIGTWIDIVHIKIAP